MGIFDFFNKKRNESRDSQESFDKVFIDNRTVSQVSDISTPESFSRGQYIFNTEMTINYGQVRTMADILIGLDEKYHFKEPDDAIKAVEEYITSQHPGHNNISVMAFNVITEILLQNTSFQSGKLNCNEIKRVFDKKVFKDAWDNALYKYYYAKIWKLVCYFNDFRQYSSPEAIIQDLEKIHLQGSKYFIMSDNAWHNGGYPKFFFARGITEAWNYIAPFGRIDADALMRYMFYKHENEVKTYGLEWVVNQNYRQDACHTDVFFPKSIGSAPVYIEPNRQPCTPRRFVKSCGEGKGPNAYPEEFEMRFAALLLIDDPNYTVWGHYDRGDDFEIYYFVPNNVSLPIYGYNYCKGASYGKRIFDSLKEKISFIASLNQEFHKANKNDISKLKASIYSSGNLW